MVVLDDVVGKGFDFPVLLIPMDRCCFRFILILIHHTPNTSTVVFGIPKQGKAKLTQASARAGPTLPAP